MPDANKNYALNSLVGAAFGAAGQRCMALSTLVLVGEAKNWLSELVERAKKLKISSGFEADTDVGPLISCDAKDRVESIITKSVNEGATLLLDGRNHQVLLKSSSLIFIDFKVEAVQRRQFCWADHSGQCDSRHDVLQGRSIWTRACLHECRDSR